MGFDLKSAGKTIGDMAKVVTIAVGKLADKKLGKDKDFKLTDKGDRDNVDASARKYATEHEGQKGEKLLKGYLDHIEKLMGKEARGQIKKYLQGDAAGPAPYGGSGDGQGYGAGSPGSRLDPPTDLSELFDPK
jgi:hypothetical protein